MPERVMRRVAPRPRRARDVLVAAAHTYRNAQQSLRRETTSNAGWQDEAWGFYESLGEFTWAVTWLANAMSRVRLLAGETVPGGSEPAPVTEGPAAEIMERLGGGVGGQSALLRALVPQVSVPGEGWVVGEVTAAGAESWRVVSTDEIRSSSRGGFEIRHDLNVWRPLGANAMVTRIWDPNPRYSYLASSAAKAALPIMRRIDLLDRRIITTLVSRLAMNGILLIPQEGTISVPEQYSDAADPFVSMIIDIASRNIQNPGSASAAIPMPVRFSSELIEQWRHLTFGDQLGTELLEERDRELRRLATALNIPAEIILGMAQANHWTAWQLEESAIKMHIAPVAEIIAHGLTGGFLLPMLEAAGVDPVGPNGGQLVCWYDTSELTARPDKSDVTFRAYDRMEVSGVALRRETGLDEGDRPTAEELREQVLKRMTLNAHWAQWALEQLSGGVTETPVGGSAPGATDTEGSGDIASPDRSEPEPPTGDRRTPRTRGTGPPPPDGDLPGEHGVLSGGWDPGMVTPDREPPPAGEVFDAVVGRLDRVADRLERHDRAAVGSRVNGHGGSG